MLSFANFGWMPTISFSLGSDFSVLKGTNTLVPECFCEWEICPFQNTISIEGIGKKKSIKHWYCLIIRLVARTVTALLIQNGIFAFIIKIVVANFLGHIFSKETAHAFVIKNEKKIVYTHMTHWLLISFNPLKMHK